MRSSLFAFAAIAGLAAFGSLAHAGLTTPGSLIVFPVFDNRLTMNAVQNLTMFTVTNTHPTDTIEVHFVYRNGTTCLQTDRFEILTANDTFSAITKFHNPNADQGYCYAYARAASGPNIHKAVKFDWLIAQEIDLSVEREDDTDANFDIPAFVFKAAGTRFLQPGDLTDRDNDGIRDLNGKEYECAPAMLLFPRFFGQSPLANGVSPEFHSDLVLINLTGGRLFDATVLFAIFNDNEVPLSAEYTFRCWTRVPLSGEYGISNMFDDSFLRNSTDNDPQEVFGAPGNFPETGWFSIDGSTADSTAASFPDPAILGVLINNDRGEERTGGAVVPFGTVLTQDNGDLLPLGLLGDTINLP